MKAVCVLQKIPQHIAKVQEWLDHANVSTTRLYDRRKMPGGQPDVSPQVLSLTFFKFSDFHTELTHRLPVQPSGTISQRRRTRKGLRAIATQ
jgi:hypothetical protein